MPELTPRLMRAINEGGNVVPAVRLRGRRKTRSMAEEMVAAEWPKHLAKLQAADAKRERRRRRNRGLS